MSDATVGRGERVRLDAIDGGLRVEKDAVIEAGASGRVTVAGNCEFRGNATVKAPIACAGDVQMKAGTVVFEQELRVRGAVEGDHVQAEVRGPLSAGKVDVGRGLRLLAPAEAEVFKVGGVMEAAQTVTGRSISVGGRLLARGIVKAQHVDVGGEASIETCDLGELSVGGQARLGGGRVSGALNIGGELAAQRALDFGDIHVGGIARLDGGGKGGQIHVGGMFSSGGRLAFREMKIGGVGDLGADATGERIDLGGTLDAKGALTLSGRMRVGGQVTVAKELVVHDVDVGGELSADRVRAHGTVRVHGSLATRQGTIAKEVETGRHSVVRGPVTAEIIRIGAKSEAEQLEGGRVSVGAGSRVDRIVGDDVEVDRDCSIGEIRYVRALRAAKDVHFGKPPVRVPSRTPPPS